MHAGQDDRPPFEPRDAVDTGVPAWPLARHRTEASSEIQRELEDLRLVMKARNGSQHALDDLMGRYTGFVRLKASSYFLAGGDSDDLIQEGMIGLYKAVRDFRPDKERRSAASPTLRYAPDHHRDQDRDAVQALTAEHVRLVQSHACRAGVGRRLHARRRSPRPGRQRPVGLRHLDRGAAEPRLRARHGLSSLESQALTPYLEGNSYEQMAEDLACDTKTIDNALQRVKRKILAHQKEREVLA